MKDEQFFHCEICNELLNIDLYHDSWILIMHIMYIIITTISIYTHSVCIKHMFSHENLSLHIQTYTNTCEYLNIFKQNKE